MTFVDEAPAQIGEVVYSWTNNGPNGPEHGPVWIRLVTAGLPAMGGFVLGLIGFFVVGGILEHQGTRVEASWFGWSLLGGSSLGLIAGVWLALRPARRSTLYVGHEGCAIFSAGKLELLEFREVEKLRVHESVMTAQGVRTSALEYHVTRNGRERLWFVSGTGPQPGIPNYDFAQAVVRQVRARQPA